MQKQYTGWIVYADQLGGDKEFDATDAGDALSQALTWAKAGVYDHGDSVEVNVMPTADLDRTGKYEPEVGTTLKVRRGDAD